MVDDDDLQEDPAYCVFCASLPAYLVSTMGEGYLVSFPSR